MHAADLHLDSPFRGLLSLPEAMQKEVRESTFKALEQLVRLAVRERADFVLISGDVYDAADRSLRAQLRFHRAVDELAAAGIRVYVVHGNHDPLSGYRAELHWPENILFFGADEVMREPAYNKEGKHVADIYGISYGQAAEQDNLASRFQASDPSLFNIALLHCNVEGRQGHDNYAPCSKQELIRSGFDYWALGHIHTREILHEAPWIVYPGNPQGRSVKESGPKGAMLVEVSGTKQVSASFHALDCIRWQRLRLDISQMTEERELLAGLQHCMKDARLSADGRSSIVRIMIEGRGPLHDVLARSDRISDLLEMMREDAEAEWLRDHSETFIWPEKLELRTRGGWDTERLLEEDSFLGDLLRLSRSLQADPLVLEAFAAEAFATSSSRLGLSELSHEQLAEWLQVAEEWALHMLAEGEQEA